jgi:hypothetical protein
MIFVTDGDYSGNANPLQDPVIEFETIVKLARENARKERDESLLIGNDAMVPGIINSVRSFLVRTEATGDKEPVAVEHGGKTLMKLFEFSPSARYFMIEALARYDMEKIHFKRTKSGYRSDYVIQPIGRDTVFGIEKIEIDLANKEGAAIDRAIFEDVRSDRRAVFETGPEMAARADDLRLNMKFWVHWRNPVYGVHMLVPDGPESQGADGLNRQVEVEFEKVASIYDTVELSPWLYARSVQYLGYDDQARIKAFWEKWSLYALLLSIPCIVLIVGLSVFFIIKRLVKWKKSGVRVKLSRR